MAVNYTTTKSMKGMSIGTIIPWTGGLGTIPPGWIACNVNFLKVEDYPLLFDVIGYTYGESADGKSFGLPESGNRTLSDITTDYLSNVSQTYTSYVGENSLNVDRPNFKSLIDVRLNINNSVSPEQAYSGRITGLNIIGPFINDSVTIADRAVGDLHMASHNHEGQYESIQRAGGSVEECQGGGANAAFTGCGGALVLNSADCCENVNYYVCELNNPSAGVNTYYITSITGGIPLGGDGASTNNRITGNVPRQINSPIKNYTETSDDTVLVSSPYNFATTLSNPYTEWESPGNDTITGHSHSPIDWSINIGSVRVQTSISTDKILPGTVQPDNSENTSVCTLDVDVQTPSLRILYIIRAW